MHTERANEDKHIEYIRYNNRARQAISTRSVDSLKTYGPAAIAEEIRAPYVYYHNLISQAVTPNCEVLDVCCGTGLHSLTAARFGARVTASDLAEKNLELVQIRASCAGLTVRTVQGDAENLPFPAGTFSLLCCAGSLSYVDLSKFLNEAKRVLQARGKFIFVDSFGHSPIYKANRYLNYLRGRRSWTTLQRIPTRNSLDLIREVFPNLTVRYFGVASFAMPLVRRCFGPSAAAKTSDWLDARLPIARHWAFKIVGHGVLNA